MYVYDLYWHIQRLTCRPHPLPLFDFNPEWWSSVIPMDIRGVIFSLDNDQQYLWAGVLQEHTGCLLDSCLFSIPCLGQSLTYKMPESILRIGERSAQVKWHDSGWEHLMLYKSIVWRSEHIVKDKWVTYSICIWFCGSLLMWAACVPCQNYW